MDANRSAPPVVAVGGPLDARTSRPLYWWLTGVSAVGSFDVAQFLATNPAMLGSAPDRAAGSVLGLVLWLLLTALAARAASRRRSRRLDRTILALAGLVAAGSLGLTAVHAAAHVGGLRPALGAVISLVALGLAISARGA